MSAPTIEEQIAAVERAILPVEKDQQLHFKSANPSPSTRHLIRESHLEYLLRKSDRGLEEIATLRAAAETLRGTQWQPIETAPKDGTWVFMTTRCGILNIARWNKRHPDLGMHGRWESKSNASHILRPTHWMPLPAIPTQDAET